MEKLQSRVESDWLILGHLVRDSTREKTLELPGLPFQSPVVPVIFLLQWLASCIHLLLSLGEFYAPLSGGGGLKRETPVCLCLL